MRPLREYFPIHPGAYDKPTAKPISIFWCKTHNRMMDEWNPNCWDFNPIKGEQCDKTTATVVLDPVCSHGHSRPHFVGKVNPVSSFNYDQEYACPEWAVTKRGLFTGELK